MPEQDIDPVERFSNDIHTCIRRNIVTAKPGISYAEVVGVLVISAISVAVEGLEDEEDYQGAI